MLTKEELDVLTNSFSDIEIAQELGVGSATIYSWRKKLGVLSFTQKTHSVKIDGLPTDQSLITPRSHKSDGYVTFFDEIDTPAKAYFLGLIATDGTIYKNQCTCAIILQKRDEDILHCLVKESGWNTQVKYRETAKKSSQPQSVLYLCSKHMVSKLADWGIVPNKSLDLEITQPIPRHLQQHFVRGAWDGDGHVSEREFNLVSGSEKFILQIREMIHSHTGVELTKGYSSRTHNLRGWKNSGQAIRWIYQDAYPVLERKAIQFSRFWSV